MQGRAFLELARELSSGGTERHWRGAAGRAYYALMLECRDALRQWGVTPSPRDTVHAFVRQRFRNANSNDLREIGRALNRLSILRNEADYEIGRPGSFANSAAAQLALRHAGDALVLLDAIDNDPLRKRTAIAAIRAAFP